MTTPATGQDVSIELLLAGVPQKITDQVTRFTANPRQDTIEHKPLGSSQVDLDKDPTGWEGEIVLNRKDGTVDDLIDAWLLAKRTRVPILILITQVVRYHDQSSRTYVYPEVVLDFKSEASRGSPFSTTLTWMTGRDRI
jgi:hypothetical protein